MNILLSAVGRRSYLVRWFREAVRSLGVDSKIIVADRSDFAPALNEGNVRLKLPAIDDPSYVEEFLRALRQYDIGLALSLNDFEISGWSTIPEQSLPTETIILSLGSKMQHLVEDKYQVGKALIEAHIDAPNTWLAAEILEAGTPPSIQEFVIKDRFGSGSSNLKFSDAHSLQRDVQSVLASVKNRLGQKYDSLEKAAQALVVQPKLQGIEHGVDIVNDFQGQFVGTLVREKLAMRSGETDIAISRSNSNFQDLGSQVSKLIGHRGLIDTDMILDASGRPWIIDINPRFGGGYPFSHVAGADVPKLYVSWLHGLESGSALNYSSDIRAAKTIDISVV